MVTKVAEDGPAAKEDIKAGDVTVEVNGDKIDDEGHFRGYRSAESGIRAEGLSRLSVGPGRRYGRGASTPSCCMTE